jgi:hypothetical protein
MRSILHFIAKSSDLFYSEIQISKRPLPRLESLDEHYLIPADIHYSETIGQIDLFCNPFFNYYKNELKFPINIILKNSMAFLNANVQDSNLSRN